MTAQSGNRHWASGMLENVRVDTVGTLGLRFSYSMKKSMQ